MFMVWILGGVVLLAGAVAVVPRALLSRAQDRLAERILSEPGEQARLLTRAEMVAGRYRRIPGVLGLTSCALSFFGVFGESLPIATSRIAKIETGTRLTSGRQLVCREVLRITRSSGEVSEFVMTRASSRAWRSHLGLWAIAQRQADADGVTPGRA